MFVQHPAITPTFRYSLINSSTSTSSVERDGATFTTQDPERWSGFKLHTTGRYTIDIRSLSEDKASLKITGAKNVDQLNLTETLLLVVTKESVHVYQNRNNATPSDIVTKTEDDPLEIRFKNAVVDITRHSISEYDGLVDVDLIKRLEKVTLEQEDTDTANSTDIVNQTYY